MAIFWCAWVTPRHPIRRSGKLSVQKRSKARADAQRLRIKGQVGPKVFSTNILDPASRVGWSLRVVHTGGPYAWSVRSVGPSLPLLGPSAQPTLPLTLKKGGSKSRPREFDDDTSISLIVHVYNVKPTEQFICISVISSQASRSSPRFAFAGFWRAAHFFYCKKHTCKAL